jgi:hypothetical protein
MRPMILSLKILLLTTLLSSVVNGEDEAPVRALSAPQPDPRGLVIRFKDGKEPIKGDHGAYVIIAWANPPAGSKERGYQIWGDKRIVTREQVIKAIALILKERPLNIVVVGNDWAAGNELYPALGKLSGRFHVDVSGGSTFRFDNVDFRTESEEIQKLVSKAITESS